MTEEEIRELEIEAAKVMGWERIHQQSAWDKHNDERIPVPDWYGYLPHYSLSKRVPQFARDPAAILEALEWVLKQGFRVHRDDLFTPYPFIVATDGTMVTGDTLGVAICEAIVALGGKDA